MRYWKKQIIDRKQFYECGIKIMFAEANLIEHLYLPDGNEGGKNGCVFIVTGNIAFSMSLQIEYRDNAGAYCDF